MCVRMYIIYIITQYRIPVTVQRDYETQSCAVNNIVSEHTNGVYTNRNYC